MTRKLIFQALENRCLLAAHGFNPAVDATAQSSETANSHLSVQAAGLFSATDAGSTRQTAANLGNLEGQRTLNGSLGWFDRSDKLAFTIDRDAQIKIDLTQLQRNADLYLTDHSGNLIARSTQGGRDTESLSGELAAGQYFVTVVARSPWSNTYELSIDVELQASPVLEEEVSPDRINVDRSSDVEPTPLQDVPYFGSSRDWNLNAIGAPEAWAAGYTGEGILVAVLDTGVDLDHPDLASNLFVNPGEIAGNGIDDDGNGFVDDVQGYDFANNDSSANDVNGHGTHVAGSIAAVDNGFGATGVAPGAKILPVQVLGADGSGRPSDVAAGIRYAAELGADIINLSLGGGYSRAIDAAIDYARSLGSLIVAAAGNESSSVPGFPARFSATDDNVISVGAHSSSGRLAGFSNDVGGSGSIQVDAPGVGVFSTYVGGRYATLSGTSMAAPHIAGLAALTLSADPELTTRELRDLLTSGAVDRAIGSDAIGTASAITSVAYAAAGLTGEGLAAIAASRVGGQEATRVRTTAVFAPAFATVEIDSLNDNDRSLSRSEQDRLSGVENIQPKRLRQTNDSNRLDSNRLDADQADSVMAVVASFIVEDDEEPTFDGIDTFIRQSN